MALELRGDQRKLKTLTRHHAREWLGPLAADCVIELCRFSGGFPTHVALRPDARVEAFPSTVNSVEFRLQLGDDFRKLAARLDALSDGPRVAALSLSLEAFMGP